MLYLQNEIINLKTKKMNEQIPNTEGNLKPLNAFQEKAVDTIIKTINVNNNIIDGVLFVFCVNGTTYFKKLRFMFKINGIEYIIEDDYDVDKALRLSNNKNIDEVVNVVVSKISQHITTNLMESTKDFWKEQLFNLTK